MSTSELRRRLEDEFDALAEQMPAMEAEVHDFWAHPEEQRLSIWGQPPVIGEIPEPADGTITERNLYRQLQSQVKPAIEARAHGFDNVPIIYPHDLHYQGPAFRTHFLAVVMGAEVKYPAGTPKKKMDGYRAWVDPIVHDLSDLQALRDVDVGKSPALAAVLQSYEEIEEIVQGRIPMTHYSPTLPLDFAAEMVGHVRFYELIASEPDGTLEYLKVCTTKWLEMMRLQETAARGRWANGMYEPGLNVGDMILSYLSPTNIRQVVIPYNRMLSEAYGGIVTGIGHRDSSLLADYLEIPNVYGCSVHEDWPAELVIDGLSGSLVLMLGYSWHYHRGKKREAPVCDPWESCCRILAQYAQELRVRVTLSAWGATPEEKRECILGDLEELRRIWETGSPVTSR